MIWTTLHKFAGSEPVIRAARYGVIEYRDGQFVSLQLRPWPKMASLWGVWWCENFGWRHREGDCCRLYYNQPLGSSDFLTLAWMQSTAQTRLESVFAALDMLDEIAELKQSEAIVCELANGRLSDRLMRRLGWARHLESSTRRHYIKRFERAAEDGDDYTPAQRALAAALTDEL